MKKRILKSLSYLAVLMGVMAVFTVFASAQEVVSGNFKFNVSGSSATLTEYTGKAKSVKIPSKIKSASVTKIAAEAFWQNKTMTSITIPSTVKVIDEAAFNECTGLTKVVIPSKVKTIGSGAFWYCTNLKTVVIPKSVTKIGSNAFKGCNNLTAYVVKGSYGETYIKKLDNVKLGYRYATSMTLSATSLSVSVNSSKTLKVTLKPSVLYSKKVSYTSADEKIATVSSSGVITGVAPGKVKITVTAKDGSGLKATCTVKVVPAKVTDLTQSSSAKTSVTLKWTKTAGAAGYKVYKYDTNTKAWVALGTTKNATYKISDLALGTSLKLRVRAYKTVGSTTYYSAASSSVTAKTTVPAKVTGLEGSSTKNSITLTWNAVKNADGYRVYYYNASTGKYTKRNDVTTTSVTRTGLKSNTKYNYTVKAYFKSGSKVLECTSYSSMCTVRTNPESVSNFNVDDKSISYDSFTLVWDKLSGVTGYRIDILNNSTGKYEEFFSTSDVNVTSFDATALQPNTEYSFKIRAFTKDSATVYSDYSSVLTVKTKNMPLSFEEAFSQFISAYNNTKSYTDKCTVFLTKKVEDITVTQDMENIVNSVSETGVSVYNFQNGEDTNGIKLDSVLLPAGSKCELSLDDIVLDTAAFEENGSGYELSFTLKSEGASGEINSLITSVVDWQNVAAQNSGFTLNECLYKGTHINAKVQDGLISYIKIEMPLEATFTLDDSEGVLNESIVSLYAVTYS